MDRSGRPCPSQTLHSELHQSLARLITLHLGHASCPPLPMHMWLSHKPSSLQLIDALHEGLIDFLASIRINDPRSGDEGQRRTRINPSAQHRRGGHALKCNKTKGRRSAETTQAPWLASRHMHGGELPCSPSNEHTDRQMVANFPHEARPADEDNDGDNDAFF